MTLSRPVVTEYETVIGLEVHAQLLTQSKMFCSCSTSYVEAAPNARVCPICLGMPGVLPAINRRAIEHAIMTALALHCQISAVTKFDRKNYPYPDLMKGYQISQYDAPLSHDGWLDITVDGAQRRIGITRVHMEEDTARLLHRTNALREAYSLVDVNRSGVPLMEIVGEPDLRSPEEARSYLISLRSILQYLGVSTGNMEDGSFRCDANISLRPMGTPELMSKVEVKNMNSFRAVYRALEYEIERQREVLEGGGRIVQETRGWVDERGATVSQRTKEHAHDYRYFPEPDLPPLTISREWVEELRARLPELPIARRERFIRQYGLSLYDASLLTDSKAQADFFEQAVALYAGEPSPGGPGQLSEAGKARAKTVSNWMLGDMARLLNQTNKDIFQCHVTPQHLAQMLDLIDEGTISGRTAKEIFEEMFHTGRSAPEIVAEKGLTQISDAQAVEQVVEQVLNHNPQAVADFRSGKQQAITFLVGQVMKETRGRAKPALVNQLLLERLGANAPAD